jgi:alpha-glucuronidase
MRSVLVVLALLFLVRPMVAEDGHAGWLRYAPLTAEQAAGYAALPSRIVVSSDAPDSLVERQAAEELALGLGSMLGRSFTVGTTRGGGAIVLERNTGLTPEAYRLEPGAEFRVAGGDARGEMYGVFRLLEMVATLQPLPKAAMMSAPAAPIRWVNQWDNLDGSIERGYAGKSIFFEGGHVRADLSRVFAYGRLLASIGINGITVNNVNSDLSTLSPEHLREFARVADQLRPWGIRMSLSVDLSSPKVIGGLTTFDPKAPEVAAWWATTVDEVYRLIPDFAGFVVKADSEGRAGPSQYGRTPAEAANVLARPLAKHGGRVLYRGFVYNHHLDWHDMKADRARAGYDNFRQLDGAFEPNVVLQVKHGPIDFQVREPVSPLLAAMPKTPMAVELQVSQEYTGQQRHMVFLVPMWKWVLDTDMRAGERATPVKAIVEGGAFGHGAGGFVAVANVGLDTNWMHHPMAMANLYGYGRLAWNPDQSSGEIVDAWTRMSFGNDREVMRTVDALQLASWKNYEDVTGPLGIGTLTDIIGVHYGPGVGSAEENGWGQWFRADHMGVGMDRTVATGTGYIGQYPKELAAVYESLKTCPDDLLLFLHHVQYVYRLHDGETVIQHMYDTHYAGAEAIAGYAPAWETLRGKVDGARFDEVLGLFRYQAGHAVVWRDAVNGWFLAESGIADARGRVGRHPERIEAEAMKSEGYTTVAVTPVETASGGKAVVCAQATGCSLSAPVGKTGSMRVVVQYFDLRQGTASFELLVNGKPRATWKAEDELPPAQVDLKLDGHTSTRFVSAPMELKATDVVTLRGVPDGRDPAAVDYIALEPAIAGGARP